MNKNLSKIIFLSLLITYANSAIAAAPFCSVQSYHLNKYYDLVPNNKDTKRKVILLTIDDGPGKTDQEIINILNNHNIKAIFFINGVHDKDFPGHIKMLSDAGFEIGNHTWNHINLKKAVNMDVVKKEIERNTKLITAIIGRVPKFFRAPYGEISSYQKELVKSNNMIYMNWSGSAIDWESSSKDKNVFIKNVTDDLHDGEILLLHGHPWTVEYLDTLLTILEEKGYTFVDPNQITN